MLALALSAWAIFVLVRRLTGSAAAAFVAGLAYAFNSLTLHELPRNPVVVVEPRTAAADAWRSPTAPPNSAPSSTRSSIDRWRQTGPCASLPFASEGSGSRSDGARRTPRGPPGLSRAAALWLLSLSDDAGRRWTGFF